jgi:hypothetical protein
VNRFLYFATSITRWPTPRWAQILVVYIGGWGVAVLCFMLWVIDLGVSDRIVYHAIGWSQFAYGAVEGTAWMLGRYDLVQRLGFYAMLGATIYALLRSKKVWKVDL